MSHSLIVRASAFCLGGRAYHLLHYSFPVSIVCFIGRFTFVLFVCWVCVVFMCLFNAFVFIARVAFFLACS